MLPSLVQTIQDLSASLIQPHSITTQAVIAIIVTLGLLGCIASIFIGPKADDLGEHDWLYTEMPAPTAHAESNQGGKVTLGSGNHVAGSPGSRCQDGE